jgi:hypothetical protein
MWLFTETGFLSAVQKDPNSEVLTVRARDSQSLKDLSEKFSLQVVKTPLADYPYRVELPKDQFSQWVASEVAAISYSNFKNQVSLIRDSKFAKLLGKVWSVMLDAEDSGARERN